MPKSSPSSTDESEPEPLPWWRVILRSAAGIALVILVTSLMNDASVFAPDPRLGTGAQLRIMLLRRVAVLLLMGASGAIPCLVLRRWARGRGWQARFVVGALMVAAAFGALILVGVLFAGDKIVTAPGSFWGIIAGLCALGGVTLAVARPPWLEPPRSRRVEV